MNFELHAALARQTEEQVVRSTRATRPSPRAGRVRRTRSVRRSARTD